MAPRAAPSILLPAVTSRFALAGIACLSAGVLVIELALTRIFSVTMFYHFAFLAVSVALFGLSASGVFVHVTPRLHPPDRLLRQLGRYAAIFWGVTILSAIGLLRLRVGLEYTPEHLARLLLVYLLAAAPFFAAGLGLTLAVSRLHADINRVYAADLTGAAAGCLLLIPSLNVFGGAGTLLLAAGLGAAASALFAFADARHGAANRAPDGWGIRVRNARLPIALLGATLAGLAIHAWRPLLDVPKTKGHEADTVVFSKWNSFSRVAVYNREHPDWGLSQTYVGARPRSLYMDIDASASTGIFLGEDARSQPLYLTSDLTGLAYGLKAPRRVLIIGPGGGRDVWTALAFGARRVDGVEVNPIIVRDVMEMTFRKYSGDIYHAAGVSVVADDGRSFVRRSSDRYDVIQASLVDTWAATTAGAFALTENNLYTVDAFVEYLRHLAPNGLLTVSRWYVDGLRLASLAREAAERLGWPGIADRLFVARHEKLATFILKNAPFTDEEIRHLVGRAKALQFVVIYAPQSPSNPQPPPRNDYTRLATTVDAHAFYRAFPWDISPPTDDRPFFFHQPVRSRPLQLELSGSMLFKGGLEAVATLLAIAAVLLGLFLIVPLAWHEPHAFARPEAFVPLVYFACLGAGFMLVEMGLMQRFVLFLGHPVYALTVVLFTLLLGGGLGSALSRRFQTPAGAIALAIPLVILAGLAYAIWLPPIFNAWVGWDRWARVLLSVALLLPFSLFLGMPLPAGIRTVGATRPGLLAWAWAINGATSVVGASVAIYIALEWGFTRVALAGSIMYALAGLAGWRLAHRRHPPPPSHPL